MRQDWWKFYRIAFFVRFSAWRALTLAFALVSLCSEQWLEPARPARALPGISRAGLWRVCYHFANIDERRLDRSSITRWWREVETSFRGLGRDSRQCSTEIGEFYGDVFGSRHMSLVELTRACAVGFIFYSAMELVCEIFYFIRRRQAKAGFASTSAAVYGGFAEIACIIACVSYAVLVARVRADTPSYISKDAFVNYLGWGVLDVADVRVRAQLVVGVRRRRLGFSEQGASGATFPPRHPRARRRVRGARALKTA